MIHIILVELFLKDGRCIPLLIIKRDNKNIFRNLHYLIEEKEDTVYDLDFRYDIFDSLSKETLDFFEKEIFNFSYKNYFDRKTWNNIKHRFKIHTQINEELHLREVKKLIKKTGMPYKPVIKYVSSEELKKIWTNEDYNIKDNIIEDLGYIIYDRKTTIRAKDDDKRTEKDILLYFLNAVFSSYYNFKIVKCKNCNKFFFAQKSDAIYCDRIFKDNKTCKNFIKCENLKKGKGLFPKLSKRIYEIQKKKGLSTSFLNDENEMLSKYHNDKSYQVKFYLSYYTDTTNGNKAKQKTINDFNLKAYLEPYLKVNTLIRNEMFSTGSIALILQ